jgi:hypothetical protein
VPLGQTELNATKILLGFVTGNLAKSWDQRLVGSPKIRLMIAALIAIPFLYVIANQAYYIGKLL